MSDTDMEQEAKAGSDVRKPWYQTKTARFLGPAFATILAITHPAAPDTANASPISTEASQHNPDNGFRQEVKEYLTDTEWPIIRQIDGRPVITRVGAEISEDPLASDFYPWIKPRVGSGLPDEIMRMPLEEYANDPNNPRGELRRGYVAVNDIYRQGSRVKGAYEMLFKSHTDYRPNAIYIAEIEGRYVVTKKVLIVQGLNMNIADYRDYLGDSPVQSEPDFYYSEFPGAQRMFYRDRGLEAVVMPDTGEILELTSFSMG